MSQYVIDAAPQVSVPVRGTAARFPVRRIYCVGRNYVEHAKEMGFTGREAPFFFLKPADAIVNVAEGTVGEVPYPSLTKDFHHEIELVVAIGQGGANIKAADAVKHIYGYAVGIDFTRRDLQGEMKKAGRPWCIGKAFDHSAPINPITPIAQCGEINGGSLWINVNGVTKQKSDVNKLIWNVAEIIEHLSAAWTLAPGDLIYTGTPEGVNAMVKGDVATCGIDKLGTLDVKII
jgi:fumarylpyruvate hydrolase